MERIIESGFCIVVRDFMAYVVPFKTKRVWHAYQTIPWYEVELPNGDVMEFNEPDLFTNKDKADKRCHEMNLRMRDDREFWISKGISALRRFERLGF